MQNASALNTLTTDRHKITVIFETGSVDCEFTVTEKSKPTDPVKPAESDEPAKPENPKTGEDFCVGFVSALLVVSALGLLMSKIVMCNRRENGF